MAESDFDSKLPVILARISQGDHRAFDVFYDQSWRVVVAEIGAYRVPQQDIPGVADDAFAGFYEAVRSGRGPDGAHVRRVWAFIRRVARNKACDYWRQKDREIPSRQLAETQEQVADSSTPPYADLIHQDVKVGLAMCLSKLASQVQELLEARFRHDRTFRDIAREVKKPEATVRTIIRRALADLELCLRQRGLAP